MIYTSSYTDYNSDILTPYSISGDRGKSKDYKGKCFPLLAPKKSFWTVWHNNIGLVPEMDNNRFYIQKYWDTTLSTLDPEKVYKQLNQSVLLCHEHYYEFCHRHLVAFWFEYFLKVKVREIIAYDVNFEFMPRPKYIEDMLEQIIRASGK